MGTHPIFESDFDCLTENKKMDVAVLESSLRNISSLGVGLNQTQQSALDTSLTIAETNYKFTGIRYWGKISGTKEDYFIVYGINKDELVGRRFLYSLNCVDWHLLQDPNQETITKAELIKGRFIGDPSYEYEHVNVERIGEGEDAHDEETVFTIKEEERLAAVVHLITDEFVAPRRAFMKSAEGIVTRNPSYRGLNPAETGHVTNWFHFRSKQTKKPDIKQQAHIDPAIDFLDTIESDIPAGVWSIQNETGSNVTLRNLKWIGLIGFGVPASPCFGCAYFGTGEPNYDLPFML